jgi:hypothetical protein
VKNESQRTDVDNKLNPQKCGSILQVVYYESIKRELKRRLTYEYRRDERLKTKNEESTRLADTGRGKKKRLLTAF